MESIATNRSTLQNNILQSFDCKNKKEHIRISPYAKFRLSELNIGEVVVMCFVVCFFFLRIDKSLYGATMLVDNLCPPANNLEHELKLTCDKKCFGKKTVFIQTQTSIVVGHKRHRQLCCHGTQTSTAPDDRYFASTQNFALELNPFTPESDQCQISPAASPEILHHTVRRTWLFIAYSDERWL